MFIVFCGALGWLVLLLMCAYAKGKERQERRAALYAWQRSLDR